MLRFAEAPAGIRISNESPAAIAIGSTIVWRATPPEPGELPVTLSLQLLAGHLATTALQGANISDPHSQRIIGFAIGSVSGGDYTNMLRLSYPATVDDTAFPASVTVTRTSRPSAAAYTATTTTRGAITTVGRTKQADYELPNNPVRMAFVQTNDTLTLTLDYAPPAPTPSHSFSIAAGTNSGFIGYWDGRAGSITDGQYELSNGQNGRIRQFMRGGSIPDGRVRFLFNGNRAADLFPDRIVATNGANSVTLVPPDPRTTASFGQGTGIDYIGTQADIAAVLVNGETVSADLYYE